MAENTRLIAAAPELLAALQAIVNFVGGEVIKNDPNFAYAEIGWEQIEQAIAAIKKATGK